MEIIEILVVRFYKNIGQRFGQKIFGKTKIYETYINIKKKLQKKGKTNNNTHWSWFDEENDICILKYMFNNNI